MHEVWRFDSLRTDAMLVANALNGIRATIAVARPAALTYAHDSPFGIFGIVLLIGFLPDAFFRHLLVPHRFDLANIGLDVLELLTALWICGAFASMVAAPHELNEETFRIRFGAFADIAIQREAIEDAKAVSRKEIRAERRHGGQVHVFTALGTGFVRVHMRSPVAFTSYPFLRKRFARTIVIPSDRPEELARLLKGRVGVPA